MQIHEFWWGFVGGVLKHNRVQNIVQGDVV